MMKAVALACVAIVIANASPARAGQAAIDVTPLVGYQWSSRVPGETGEFDVESSINYGVVVDIDLSRYAYRGSMVELMYLRQDSELTRRFYYGAQPETLFDIAVEYYMIGGVQKTQRGNTEPFLGFLLGAARFAPKDSRYSDEWRFAVSLGAGVKVQASERLGLRLHGRLLMPIQAYGGGMWCGPAGCGASVGGSTTLLQGDIGIGLVINL